MLLFDLLLTSDKQVFVRMSLLARFEFGWYLSSVWCGHSVISTNQTTLGSKATLGWGWHWLRFLTAELLSLWGIHKGCPLKICFFYPLPPLAELWHCYYVNCFTLSTLADPCLASDVLYGCPPSGKLLKGKNRQIQMWVTMAITE